MSSDLKDFGFKSHADAIEAICKQIGAETIVLGGHDWGGAAVYRIAQWKPQLVSHVFSVCTPYFRVLDQYVSTQDIVDSGVKQFGYQLQFGSEDGKVEAVVKDERTMRNFLLGAYGGQSKSGKKFMTPEQGVFLDVVRDDDFEPSPLLNPEVRLINHSHALGVENHVCLTPSTGNRLLHRRIHEKRHPRAMQLVPHATSQLRRRDLPAPGAPRHGRPADALRLRHWRQNPQRGPAEGHG
jgi:pimeloyl-ACP methyl ester carboxylesterase